MTAVMKPSIAQAKILKRMGSGGTLALNPKTGRYCITENGVSRNIDQRPVEVMIRDGILCQDLGGHCWPADLLR